MEQENLEVTKSTPKQWVNRSNRRQYLKRAGILKSKSKLNLKDWASVTSSNIENGKKRGSEYEILVRNGIEEQLVQMEKSLILNCNQAGYSKEETDTYLQSWQESLKPWPNYKL